MAQPIYTQTKIAMIWDFDKTLIKGYSQAPLFAHYGVDAAEFWQESNELEARYAARGIKVGKDTVYLNHMLTYVEQGRFADLTNSMLRDLGAGIEMSDGIPDFLTEIQRHVAEDERYAKHELEVEHYVVSTGIRQLIEGSAVGGVVKEIWANEFVDQPPPPGYVKDGFEFGEEGPIAQIGYVVDNTSKTRAIFEINKGPDVDVNARIGPDDRRIPIPNMIYIADGPSDVPVFSVVTSYGGRCFGVYQDTANFGGVKKLQDEGRVHGFGPADFRPGTHASLWLEDTVRTIANRICDDRDKRMEAFTPPAGHVT
jgi:hypothetical protein